MQRLVQLAYFAFLLGPISAQPATLPDEPVLRSIGGKTIRLPAPAGFADGTQKAGALSKAAEQGTVAAKRFLALFAADTDLTKISKGGAPDFDRYFVVQSMRQSESITMTQDQFEGTKKVMRLFVRPWVPLTKSALQDSADKATQFNTSQKNGIAAEVKVGDVSTQGVFDEGPNFISITGFVNYQVTLNGKTVAVPMVISNTTLLITGKVIYLQVCSDFKSAADVEWTQAESKAWIGAINAANR